MKSACYAGSFDPLTNGHLYMVEQGLNMFDKLYVAIGINPLKKCTFSIEQRKAMIEKAISSIDCRGPYEVCSFENKFLVNYTREIGAEYMIRGIRSSTDFEYERTMRHVNEEIAGDSKIATVFLIPPRELMDVSSSFVKALVGPEGWQTNVRRYLPTLIADDFISHYEDKTSAK